VLSRWLGWFAAVVVTLVTCGLVVLDLADAGTRRWWMDHALTTDTVAGLLVLLVTILVVDQVVRRRQVSDRARAVAAQAAIMVGQAARSARAVSAAADGSGDRSVASDEVRTYMIMLLVGAPVLIDARVSRNFLEEAQHLGGEMARTLAAMSGVPGKPGAAGPPGSPAASSGRLDDAVQRLRAASTPLLQQLNPEERTSARTTEADTYSP
jgi:hypothetical protein